MCNWQPCAYSLAVPIKSIWVKIYLLRVRFLGPQDIIKTALHGNQCSASYSVSQTVTQWGCSANWFASVLASNKWDPGPSSRTLIQQASAFWKNSSKHPVHKIKVDNDFLQLCTQGYNMLLERLAVPKIWGYHYTHLGSDKQSVGSDKR